MTQTIQLKGGLDLVSPPTNINPGSLFDCHNFEVALTDGYRRIDGLQRFDGRPVPESIQLYTLRAQYADNEDQGLYFTPLYEGGSYTWPPEGFSAPSVGDEVFYQFATSLRMNATGVTYVRWSDPMVARIVEVPEFVEVASVDSTVRTGLVYLFDPRTPKPGQEAPSGAADNTYPREALSDSSNIRSTTLFPGVGRPSTEGLPGSGYGIFNNILQSYQLDIDAAQVPWDSYNTTFQINQSIYRQSVKEFPGGHALGMEWVDDKQYAVAETRKFSYSSLDDDVLALLEPGQWCYYNPTYQLTTDGPLGVTNNRSQIETHGATIYQDAHCLHVGGEIELLIPQLDPIRSGEDTEPVGLDIYLLTELRIKNIVALPSPGDSVTTSGGYAATVRGVYLDEDGATGRALVETSSKSVAADDVILKDGNEQFTVVSVFGGSDAGSPLCEIAEVDTTGNDAVLVESTYSMGYQPVDMGYELRFESGAVEPLTVYEKPKAEAEADDTGQLTGDRAEQKQSGAFWQSVVSASTVDLTPESIEANDSDYAKFSVANSGEQTRWLVVSDLGMLINGLDSITGMEVTVVAEKASGGGVMTVERVGYYDPDEDRVWSKTFHESVDTKDTFTFGGQNDNFSSGHSGQPSLTPRLVNKPGFGIAIRCKVEGSGTYPCEGRIYQVQVKVHYVTGSTQVWLYDGSSDLTSAQLMHKHLEAGAWGDSDAEGVFSMRGDMVDLEPGTQIRTQASGAGNLIATVASGPDLARLPGLDALDRERSQYLFMTTNFFAAEHLKATYGVSGAGPAFAFNDDYFFFIRTGVEEDKAKPRHLSRLRDRLVLAYKNGNLDVSSPGDPAVFEASTEGAATLGVGEKVTGLLTLQGESMAVFTENQIIAWQGADNETFQSNVISPASGAIEYTVADMGMPVFCDFRGIGTISTSEKYGDFERGRLSAAVTPWLAPRLQGASKGTDDDISVAGVLLVRNKNQYRVIFRDGKVLTMTMKEAPEFTIQEYRVKRPGRYADAAGAELDPVPDEWQFSEGAIDLIAACWGVTENGQDRIFISSRDYPYVLEVDRGITFDGQAISSSFTTNMGSAGDSGQNKRLNVLHFYGQVRGFATLDHRVGMDYALPEGKPVQFRIGEETDDYYRGSRPAFTKTRTSARGRDVFLKVSHESATEQPFTMQAFRWLDASPRRMER